LKVFVTGGTGFVGRGLVTGLLQKGHQVRCLARDIKKARDVLPDSVEIVQGDVTQPRGLEQVISGCGAVIHLVGIIVERRDATFEQVHVQGTLHVVEAAKQAGIRRYLHMSALGSRPSAVSRYHQTKYQAEECVRQSGLNYTIFRPSVIFGPSDRFVNLLARLIRISPVVMIIGDGKARIQPIALADVVHCFVSALDKEETIGKVYELGGARALSFEEVVDTVLQVMGRRRLKIHLPVRYLKGLAYLLEKGLPVAPLTRDQLIMLQEDNTCEVEGIISQFGIRLQDFAVGIRTYLHP
jgi:NADH dehydrogenase